MEMAHGTHKRQMSRPWGGCPTAGAGMFIALEDFIESQLDNHIPVCQGTSASDELGHKGVDSRVGPENAADEWDKNEVWGLVKS